jgi:hypothetical protein
VRIEIDFAQALSIIMLTLGTIALTTSIMFISTILAFIGLGLVFWGVILIYIRPEEYAKKVLLEAAVSPSIATLNQMIQEFSYKGDVTYLPPKYFADPETTKIYISKHKDTSLPTPEQVQKYENQPVARTPRGMLLTPPGIQLSRLLEKSLGTTFIRTDLKNLQQNLPRLFIENLEIAENLEIRAEDDMTQSTAIHAKITKPFYADTFKEAEEPSQLTGSIGDPICSAIACALTKATGKPIIMETFQPSEDGKIIEATYRVLETTEPREQTEKAPTEAAEVIKLHPSRLSNVAGLFLIALGSTILVWVGWLTWYDITTWSKDLILIFFGSRTGETMSLGIGMRVIYYFLIGLALLFSGLITLVRRRRRKV